MFSIFMKPQASLVQKISSAVKTLNSSGLSSVVISALVFITFVEPQVILVWKMSSTIKTLNHLNISCAVVSFLVFSQFPLVSETSSTIVTIDFMKNFISAGRNPS